MGNKFYPSLNWDDYGTLTQRVQAIYNVINNVSYNMSVGRVPQNKKELEEQITTTESDLLTPLSIAFVKMAEEGKLDDVTLKENKCMFLPWIENVAYTVGAIRTREIDGVIRLFKSLQAHTSQTGWEPENTPALWNELIIAEDGVEEWSRPISSADAYNKGNEVMFNEKRYRSTIDGNVWSPEEYPQGWEEVIE